MSLLSSISNACASIGSAAKCAAVAIKDYVVSPIASAMHSYIVMSNIPRMIVDMRVKMSGRAFGFWASTLPFGTTLGLLLLDDFLGPSFSHLIHALGCATGAMFFAYIVPVGGTTEEVTLKHYSHEGEQHEHHEEGPDEPRIDFPWWGITIVVVEMLFVIATIYPHKIREALHHHPGEQQPNNAKTWFDYLTGAGGWLYNLLALPVCAYELSELVLMIYSAVAHDSETNPEELNWEVFDIKIAVIAITTIISLVLNQFKASRAFKEKFSDSGLKLASFLWFYLKVFQPIPNDEVADSVELFHLSAIALCSIISGGIAHFRFGGEHEHSYHGVASDDSSTSSTEGSEVGEESGLLLGGGKEKRPESDPLTANYGSFWSDEEDMKRSRTRRSNSEPCPAASPDSHLSILNGAFRANTLNSTDRDNPNSLLY